MNRTCRSIWNEVRRTFIATAESVRARGKPASGSRGLDRSLASLAAGELLADRAHGAQAPPSAWLRSTLRPLALEQRFMFDGAAVATVVDAHVADTALTDALTAVEATAAQTEQGAAERTGDSKASLVPQVVREADPALNNGRREVAFVDTAIGDWQTLVASIRPGVEVVLLDAGESGLAQMAAWAQTHSGYDAIHLLSHGSTGVIYLGQDKLTQSRLDDAGVKADLAALGAALTADGDLLIYGCSTAAGDAGQRFIAALSSITGADVAASDDATGAARLGGDWTLEQSAGNIETAIVLAAGSENAWDHELATVDFSSTKTVAADYSSASVTVSGVTITGSSSSSAGVNITDQDAIYDTSYGGTLYKRSGLEEGGAPDSAPLVISFSSAVNLTSLNLILFWVDFALTGTGSESVVKLLLTPTGGSNSAVTATFLDNNWDGTANLNWTGVTSVSITRVAYYNSDTTMAIGVDDIVFTTGPTGPTVSDANISVTSAGTGTGGAYKVGDTVTAKWNNTSGGENQSGITGVTMDFSAFGGGSAVTASNDGSGNWSASYTITSGSIDAANLNVSVKATDGNGSTTTADSSNLTVDNQAPTVTDARISISGATGTGGAYKTGDTVTVTWNNTGAGDNNADISSVSADFSAFGGGTVAASNSGGSWTASYVIAAGSIDAINRNVSLTVTDDAGNTTTRTDSSNATVDNQAPTVNDANISISGATGAGGLYKAGDTVTATWNNTGAGDNNADTLAAVTFDFSAFGGGAAVAATNVGGTWTATYVIAAGSINSTNRNVSVTVTDNAGNTTTRADTSNASVDNQAPSVSSVSVPANATYGNNQNLDFTVNFDENVTVDTTGGTPRIALTIGATTQYASYVSGSGTSALVFRYTVESGLSDTDGITVGALSVNGGSLKDSAGNNAAVILNSVGATTSVLVDSAGPTLSSSTPADNATGVSPSANIVLNFNENVAKGTGNIIIKKTSDNSVVETIAVGDAKVSVSGTQVTINPDATLLDSTEYYVLIDSGAFTDSHSNAYAGISSTTALSFTTTDTAPPLLSSSSPADNATAIAANADIVLTFNESVVKGTGNIVIKKTPDDSVIATIDVTSGQVTISGSVVTINPTSDLAFGTEYYVQIDAGAIKDLSNNNYAGIGDTTSLSFTTGGPSVTGVTGVDGSYKAGDTVDITVTFDGAVDVTGSPTLTLANGATALYVSGSGTSALVFRYTVAAGNTSADLDYASTSALSLAGGTIIANGGSVAAVLTLPTPGATGSLGDNQNIVVDTTAPTVTSIVRQTPSSGTTNADTLVFRVTFGEAVTNVDAADFIVTGTTGTVTNVASAGGNAYDITVSGGDLASLNGTVTLGFAGGQNIADSAGNALSSTTPSATNHATYTLDNTAPTVSSITRQTPFSSPTNADSITWRVTFAEAVSNVDAADFSVSGTTGTVTGVVSAGGNAYDVTVSGGNLASLDGTLILSFAGGQNIADSAGNALSVTTPTGTNDAGFVIDNTAPGAPTLAATGGGTSTSVTLSGTSTANATVEIYHGATVLGTVTADGTGAYTFTTTLAAGTYTLTSKARDPAGNESAASAPASVTVNSEAPPPVINEPPAPMETLPTPMPPTFDLLSPTLSPGVNPLDNTVPSVSIMVPTLGLVMASEIPRFSGTLTVPSVPGGFRVVVLPGAAAGGDTLMVNRGVPDMVAESGGALQLVIPADAFAHTNPQASVQLRMTLADGRPLPSWVSFDPRTGKLNGVPPAGFNGDLVVRLVARDSQGREAVTTFRLVVGKERQAPEGRSSLSEQLRLAARPSGMAERLAALSQSIEAARRLRA